MSPVDPARHFPTQADVELFELVVSATESSSPCVGIAGPRVLQALAAGANPCLPFALPVHRDPDLPAMSALEIMLATYEDASLAAALEAMGHPGLGHLVFPGLAAMCRAFDTARNTHRSWTNDQRPVDQRLASWASSRVDSLGPPPVVLGLWEILAMRTARIPSTRLDADRLWGALDRGSLDWSDQGPGPRFLLHAFQNLFRSSQASFPFLEAWVERAPGRWFQAPVPARSPATGVEPLGPRLLELARNSPSAPPVLSASIKGWPARACAGELEKRLPASASSSPRPSRM